ncbi:polymeric immunoglobulin receptor-like [Pangasianodon hypophthalmus]|uniref:polymeric immunoglobulin receptor-like n=1 Tax=Pangasianodon hypophthalmus TaxID=310915 RepID=UPI002307533C|nr:polymeric immunoglobulin receptor-like [Pangasianodon hypophthalmus]
MKILLIFTLCLISGLTVEDTGTYQCGVDKNEKDIYPSVEWKVKEVSGGLISREVSAYAGGGINIKWRYEDEYKDKPKSFCKIGTQQWCFNRTETKLNRKWSHDGRFAVHDNRSAGFFNVFIRQLITEDTGTYVCAVAVSDEIKTCTVVKLNVTEDLSYEKSISKTVHVGGDLNFSCKYPESLSGNKFLCKRLQTAACPQKTSVKESRKDVNMGKFSLYDDSAEKIFNVSIRNVTEQDSGEYWCGASWKSDGYKVYFTQINLTVTEPRVSGSTSKPTQPSSSSSSPSPSLASSSSSSSDLIQASPPAGLPASTVITVSVILLLLFLIGIILLTLTLQKRHKMQGFMLLPSADGFDYNYPHRSLRAYSR